MPFISRASNLTVSGSILPHSLADRSTFEDFSVTTLALNKNPHDAPVTPPKLIAFHALALRLLDTRGSHYTIISNHHQCPAPWFSPNWPCRGTPTIFSPRPLFVLVRRRSPPSHHRTITESTSKTHPILVSAPVSVLCSLSQTPSGRLQSSLVENPFVVLSVFAITVILSS